MACNLSNATTSAGPFFFFDGHKFDNSHPMLVLALYIGRKARAGEQDAIDLLNAFNVRIVADGGVVYWPPEQTDHDIIVPK